MPTFKVWLAAGLLALPGCTDIMGEKSVAPSQIQLPDGLVVAGANGWCIDTASTSARGEAAVVVLGSCAAIGQDALAPRPDVPGVVTVSVERDPLGAFSPEDLQAFFVSDVGRAALARNGEATSVDILDTRAEDGRFFLHMKDSSALPGASPLTWRALFDLGGRFVSVSLYGLSDQPIEPDEGLDALEAQVDQLIAANQG